MTIPKETRTLVLKRSTTERKPVYHDAVVEKRPIPALQSGQVLVKMGAVALNRRDVCIIQSHLESHCTTFGYSFGFALRNIQPLRLAPRSGLMVQVGGSSHSRETRLSQCESGRDCRRIYRSS